MLASDSMIRTLIALPAILALLAVAAACGDGPDKSAGSPGAATATTAAPTPITTPAAAGTKRPADPFGPAPRLGGSIDKISPEHAASVTQASTRSPNPQRPNGACAEVNFRTNAQDFRWFRMAFDGEEVTTELTIIAPSQDSEVGKVCYGPEAGFAAGRHQVALSVEDPDSVTRGPIELVAWEFNVR
jgi:hypothetical protein